MKTWFDNVGQWFKTLGDNIKGFFDNLWDNISNNIKAIENSVKTWWQGVVDWFDNLFKVDDGYFTDYLNKWDMWLSEHFGLLYEVISLPITIVNALVSAFDSGSYDSLVHIPQIKLPWGNHVLIESYDFDLESFYNSNDIVASVFLLLKTFINALLIAAFINSMVRVMHKQILKDEEE